MIESKSNLIVKLWMNFPLSLTIVSCAKNVWQQSAWHCRWNNQIPNSTTSLEAFCTREGIHENIDVNRKAWINADRDKLSHVIFQSSSRFSFHLLRGTATEKFFKVRRCNQNYNIQDKFTRILRKVAAFRIENEHSCSQPECFPKPYAFLFKGWSLGKKGRQRRPFVLL